MEKNIVGFFIFFRRVRPKSKQWQEKTDKNGQKEIEGYERGT